MLEYISLLIAVIIIIYLNRKNSAEKYEITHDIPRTAKIPIAVDQPPGYRRSTEVVSDDSIHRAKFQRQDAAPGPSKIGIRDKSVFKDTEYLVFDHKIEMG